MEVLPTTLEDVLANFYDSSPETIELEFWKRVGALLNVSQQSSVVSLYTAESLIFKVFKFLTSLPFKKNSRKILKVANQYLDPSPQLLKKIIQELVPSLENGVPCLSTLNVCLAFYNSVFEQQTPANENINSHIYLCGPEEGIKVKQPVKWLFEKGGTLAFWYNMSEKTKQCRIFEFMTADRVGFQIVMRNRKIYIEKEEDETKFRLIKTNSSYLCDAVFNKNVKLCFEFEIKKKFFQPYISVNLIMNNFAINGVQIDSFSVNAGPFLISLFKGFHGKFFASLILTDKLAAQVDEMNNQKGFIYESDIRNFSYLFEKYNQKIFLFFTSIRARTILQEVQSEEVQEEIEDQLRERVYDYSKPIKTIVYDAIGNCQAEIGSKACCFMNSSINKQIGNYGDFQSLTPFLKLLEACCIKDEMYVTALNQFLELIKLIFQNKTDSIEKACSLKFFKQLSFFIEATKMEGLTYETITNLKQIYIALNTRMLRQKFIQEVVWGANFGLHLNQENFANYLKFIKTFYNEDMQSSLNSFGVPSIFAYILQNLDTPDCCFNHMGAKTTEVERVKNYPNVLLGIFEIIENILLIKRTEEDINQIIKEVYAAFALPISACFIESLITFIYNLFLKDSLLEQAFLVYIQKVNPDYKFYLYKCLSNCNSWKAKGRMIQFILKMLQPNFFDEDKNDKQMLTLCARYPTMNYLRNSSIKSQQNRDSIDYSQEKLSLNSATMHKLIIINPIQNKDEVLLDDIEVVQVISNWAFSENVINLTSEQQENPGLLILMELYKGSTYKLRQKISKEIHEKMKIIRFSPQLMAWAIECSLVAEFDLNQIQTQKFEIESTKFNFIEIICNYDFFDAEEEDNNEISIIKLVFSSVKSKYPDDIVRSVGNKLFFLICDKKMQIFVDQLKDYDQNDRESYDKLCWRIISNVFTFINEYYVIKGDDEETGFDEDLAEILQSENYIIIEIMEKILQILVLVATINDRKIIEEANAERNHLVITMLLPEKEKDKERINIMHLIIFALHNIFDSFEDIDIDPKKKCLLLMKKYIIYIIQLTENSGSAKLEPFQQDLRNVFLLCLGFFQQKHSHYFYFPFEKHKNLDFHIENKIRKSIDEIKKVIFTIILDLIELIQYIDEKGSLEHKSFYELMKPKRKPVHKYSLKHIYPTFWKKVDEKIIEFISLKRETLRKDAQEKLESHLILKRVSQACSQTEKQIAKKLYTFVEEERKQSDTRERKSVNFYKISESEKCRSFCQCEQQLTEFRLRIEEQQRHSFNRRKEEKEIQKRDVRSLKKKQWNQNRIFNGFWANKNFFSFCQNEPLKTDNSLSKYYKRVRSKKQSRYFLMPFVVIETVQESKSCPQQQVIYASEVFLDGIGVQKSQKKRTSQKLINGLQFIKRKVYSKIVKTINFSSQPNLADSNQNERVLVQNVLWIQPMKVFAGHFKIESKKMSFCHKLSKGFGHISLYKNTFQDNQTLIEEWNLDDIEGFLLKRFMLKLNSIEVYFKNRQSIFLCFNNSTEDEFYDIVGRITKLWHSPYSDQQLIQCVDSVKMWEKLQLTQKWLNYKISNFDYLMCLNIGSGRTSCDLNQYPIMPWILSQYQDTKVKKKGDKFRDFGKNTALLGKEERVRKFKQLYQTIVQSHSDQFPIPHFFGFHYSNMGIILQYLIRMNPFSEGSKCLQGGKFDISDRLFYSIPESFKCATSEMSDLRELIPEFFYLPDFLINNEEFDFGKLQGEEGKKVNHVELPDGCLNAYDFIETHREALQSKEVSANLHKWIDLIFGFKNSGKEAEKAMNTYHYLTNQSNCDRPDLIEDPQQKEALESQMAYYGKTPSQLFSRPHPQRLPKNNEDFQTWDKVSFGNGDYFSKLYSSGDTNLLPQIIHLSYCEKTRKYVIFSKNGHGIVFGLDREQFIRINEFCINYQKVEGVNIVDRSLATKIPVASIEAEYLVIGGLWGGKLLISNITNSNFDFHFKHSETVTCLKYSTNYCLLWSGSKNGQLCKWQYKDGKLHFESKVYNHSQIKSIQIDEDLKVVAICSQDGCLSIFGVEDLDLIRVIKVGYCIEGFSILRYPYYHILIVCKEQYQFCYSLNGTKLEQTQMQACGNLLVQHFDCISQTVLIRMGNQLVFLKTPELSIEQKLQVGIGENGFILAAQANQILALNESQLLIWRRHCEQKMDRSKSI